MKVVIVGGVAGGATAAARIRRFDITDTGELFLTIPCRHEGTS